MLLRLTLSVALLAGLTSAPLAAEPVQLNIVHYQKDKSGDLFKSIIKRFEAENPDIHVVDTFKPDTTITADLQTMLAARRPVDLGTVIGIRALYFVKSAAVVPINADPAKSKWLENYLPQFLEVGKQGDKIFAVPYAFGTPMLYYNKDLFKKAGLDPEVPPQTWDEVIAAAIKIQAATGVPGVAHLHASGKVYGTMLMVRNAGGRYLNDTGDRLLVDSPEGIAALTMWQDLAVKHKVMPIANDGQWTSAFLGGRLAMYITSSALLRQAVSTSEGKFALGVTQYPMFKPGMKRTLPNSGATFMLFSPEGPRRDAALKFLEFISRLEIANEWARESGYMPLMRDPLRDPAMKAYADSFPFVKPVIAQMADTVATDVWTDKDALEAEAIMNKLIDDLWAGKGEAKDLVPEAVKRANATLAR